MDHHAPPLDPHPDPAVGSPAVPPSDPGDLEETRAALLGPRYWQRQLSTTAEPMPVGSEMLGNNSDDDDDELVMSAFEPRTSSSAPHAPLAPSPSFAAPPRALPSSPLGPAAPSRSSPSASHSHSHSTQSSLPSPRKLVATRARSPVRLVSPVSSLTSDEVVDLVSRAHHQRPSRSRPESPPRSQSRSPTPRARATPRTASSLPAARSPSPLIPPEPDPAPAGRSLRQRTAAQLKPYSTEQQRYTVRLLRNGWEGAVVRGVPTGAEAEGLSADEVRRRKEVAERRERERRERLGGWLVEEGEEADEGEGGTSAGSTPRAGGSGAARRREGWYEREGAYRSDATREEGEGEEDDGTDGTDLLEREARRKDRLRRDVDAALRGRKRKHSPHRHGPSRIDDPQYHDRAGEPTRRHSEGRGGGAATKKRLRVAGAGAFSDDVDPTSDSGSGDDDDDDPLPPPEDVGRAHGRAHGRSGASKTKTRKRRREAGHAGRSRGRAHPRSHRAESAPPSSSPAHSPHKARARPSSSSSLKHKGGKRRGARGGSEPAREARRGVGVGVGERPRGMGPPRGSVRGWGGERGEERWEGELRALGSGSDKGEGDGEALERRERGTSEGESDAPSVSSSSVVMHGDDEEDDEDGPEDPTSSDARPAPRLEVRGKRRRALGAMMPAVFLKKAVADLELMKRERRARARGSGSDEDDELNSGDEEALERERERRERHRARVRTRAGGLEGDRNGHGAGGLGTDVFTDESGSAPERSDDDDDDAAEDEADAVASWLDSFAPRRGGGAAHADEDIVDRFLRRARRPPRSRASKRPATAAGQKKGASRGAAKDAAAPGAAGRGAGRGGAADKHRREVLRDSGNYVAGHRPVDGPTAPTRQRPRQVALDTDEAVFAFVGLRDGAPRAGAAEDDADEDIVTVSPRRRAAASSSRTGPSSAFDGIPAAPLTAPAPPDGEVWASFGRFSHDFDLHRLPAGVRFTGGDSFVRNGYLFSLVDAAALPQGPGGFSADAFGCALLSSMTADELDPLVPTLCDGAYDALAASVRTGTDGDDAANPLVEIGSALRFLGHWVSTQVARVGSDALARLGTALTSHLDRLETRLDAVAVPEAATKRFRLHRIVVSWHIVDLAARLHSVGGGGADSATRLQRLVVVLIRRLIQHGVDRTTRSLKAATEAGALVSDVTVEAWLALVSLALSHSDALSEGDLWQVVLDQTRATLAGTKAARGPAGGEVVSYTAMMLCAVSQFSPSGISTSKPRLAAHWPALLSTLETIQPAALALPDHTLSSTAVARRDRYLWTLFARCLVFVERWGWKVDIRDELLPRLFDLLNARRLADLTTEAAGDFPAFLQDLAEFGRDVALDPRGDTAFVIFVKLVVAAAGGLPSSTDAEKRRRGAQLTRLFLRLSPMVSSAWSRHSAELKSRGPSVLVNHYSLHLAFAALLPSAAPQRIEQAARLIAFSDVDDEARKTCIRAALYFALVARWHRLALAPVVDWLAGLASTLKSEYGAVERERRKDERLQRRGGGGGVAASAAAARRASAKGDPLWTRAVMITMVLRSVQVIVRWKRPAGGAGASDDEHDFPDLALLHPAWTSQLLDSPLALDPMIGREAIRTVECFLDVRRAALPRASASTTAASGGGNGGESQDDFGMLDDLDFDDPALNAMLGIQGGGGGAPDSQQQREDDLKAKDNAFAEVLRSTIAPAFFRLVSNIFVDQSGSGPTVVDRVSYAQTAVECWTRCLAVAVENRVADWRPYLQYGDQSWKRLSDPVGRRDIGLFLVIQILKHDPAVYSVFADDVLEILFESIVAKRLTSQHVLLEQLLNVEQHEHLGTVSPLLEGLPFARSTHTGRVEVEQLDLLDKRLQVLSILFRNAARLVALSTPAQAGPGPLSTTQLLHRPPAHSRGAVSRGTVMNLLRSMLASMRDNLSAIHDEASRAQYASFVRLVLAALAGAGAGQGQAAGGARRGPFDEMALPDMRTLRSAVA